MTRSPRQRLHQMEGIGWYAGRPQPAVARYPFHHQWSAINPVRQQRPHPLWQPDRHIVWPGGCRLTYEAYMRLLVENKLVAGLHAQGGASSRLVIRPRPALAYL